MCKFILVKYYSCNYSDSVSEKIILKSTKKSFWKDNVLINV